MQRREGHARSWPLTVRGKCPTGRWCDGAAPPDSRRDAVHILRSVEQIAGAVVGEAKPYRHFLQMTAACAGVLQALWSGSNYSPAGFVHSSSSPNGPGL